MEKQPWICPEMFALVFTSHQKTHNLRGFPRKQKFNGKDSVLFSIYGLYETKKGKRKKGEEKEKEFVDLHDERIKYFGHFDV